MVALRSTSSGTKKPLPAVLFQAHLPEFAPSTPDSPEVPLVPLEPLVPEEPLLPLEPDVPLVPDVPPLPDVPAAANQVVPLYR